MIFEIDEIPEGGLNFDLIAKKEQFKIDHSDCSLIENVKVKGKLKRIDHEVFFAGELQTLLQVICTRCLKAFSLPVKNKIQVQFHYPYSLNKTGALSRKIKRVKLINSEKWAKECISLPLHPYMPLNQAIRTVNFIKKYFRY